VRPLPADGGNDQIVVTGDTEAYMGYLNVVLCWSPLHHVLII